MNNKLEKLLKQINLEDSFYSYFNNASLEKIVGNSNKDSYAFFINNEEILPIDVYASLCHKLDETFKDIKNKTIKLSVKNKNYSLIADYFKYFTEELSQDNHTLLSLIDLDVVFEGDKFYISFDNQASLNLFRKYEDKYIKMYENAGYENVKFEIEANIKEEVIDNTAEVDLNRLKNIDKISEEKPKRNWERKEIETVEDENVLLGRIIDTEVSRIDTANEAVNSITFEGYIFGIDIRETKTDLVIITLKITDETDSIYGKIFTADKERLGILKKNLKENKWYKFRGSIKEDKYSNELALNITDINYSDKKKKQMPPGRAASGKERSI